MVSLREGDGGTRSVGVARGREEHCWGRGWLLLPTAVASLPWEAEVLARVAGVAEGGRDWGSSSGGWGGPEATKRASFRRAVGVADSGKGEGVMPVLGERRG